MNEGSGPMTEIGRLAHRGTLSACFLGDGVSTLLLRTGTSLFRERGMAPGDLCAAD
jgi:hypothetical protein